MTVIGTESTFTAMGGGPIIAFDIQVFLETDISVVVIDSAGTETDLVLNSDYEVQITNPRDLPSVGQITLTPPLDAPWATDTDMLEAGYSLKITRTLPLTQPVSLSNIINPLPRTIEQMTDRLTLIAQQLSQVGDTGDLESDIEALQSSVADLQTLTNGFTTRIGGLDTSVASLEAADTGFTTSINTINSSVSDLQAEDMTISQSITALSATVAALQATVDAFPSAPVLSYFRTQIGSWENAPNNATWTELSLTEGGNPFRVRVMGTDASHLLAGDQVIFEFVGPDGTSGQTQTYRIDKERWDTMVPGSQDSYANREDPVTTEAFKVHFGLAGHRSVKVQVSPTDSSTIAVWVSNNTTLAMRLRVYWAGRRLS